MERPDITDDLVHFIQGDTAGESFDTLCKILDEQTLLGGTGFIKGNFTCVCFSEAPMDVYASGLDQRTRGKKPLQRFGILLKKRWLFERGGRPVIYGPDTQFQELSQEFKWRHVRYEPTEDSVVDFTWEREWRICTDRLEFAPGDVRVVVGSAYYANCMCQLHDREQDRMAESYRIAGCGEEASLYRIEFPWTVVIPEN